ncbi:hypothetical protein [Nostoc sp. DSM 114167]|uniref:hypothetical protein n=1 Tax=Nostoc sp. DSM 114167 TaxID=3439050 RepID=UPI004046653D
MEDRYLESLTHYLDEIKDSISEDFATLEFTDGRHPREQIEYIDLSEIQPEITSIEIHDASVFAHTNDSVTYNANAIIFFSIPFSSPDLDTGYYDHDAGEIRYIKINRGKSKPQICIIPVEIVLNFEDGEVVEIESVSLDNPNAIPVDF